MFINSAIKLKVGIITGMIIGSGIAFTAKHLIENRSCMFKCTNKLSNTDKEIEDPDEHPKN